MKTRMIHENLDTSFVNVSALLEYLRRREFAGCIRIKSSGYEAEIFLSGNNTVNAREHDRITGTKINGEKALQRILNRTREPGGIINVFQTLSEGEESPSANEAAYVPQTKNRSGLPVDNEKTKGFPQTELTENLSKPASIKTTVAPKPKVSLPDFPFDLSNCVEEKVRQTNLSNEDWKSLMQLTAELLFEIDKILWSSRINFSVLLKKICAEVAADYTFLNPSAGVFDYKDGKLIMRERINAKLFTAGINEILRRLLQKLSANAKFAEIERLVSQKIIALIHGRKSAYARFHFIPQLEKILGV